jgi:peptidoglycan/LPS O-acetylase OafA/YrhL
MAATPTVGSERRIAYVDGLRAVAVLLVVVHHTAKWNDDLGQGVIQQICAKGAHGVDLFFVLSGFCLSYPVLRALHDKGWATFDAAGYMARRVVRIVPPFWIAIAVLYAFLALLPHVGWRIQDMFSLSRVNWFEIGKQALFLDRRPEFLSPSFWTLPIEWRWYFLFPLFLALWTRSARTYVTVLIACGAGVALTRVGGFDLGLLPGFLLGIIAADLELRSTISGRLMALLCGLGIAVALAMESFYVLEVQPGWQVGAFFLVLAAGALPWLRAVLSSRPLVFIGIASYSIYLVHEPVIAAIEHNTKLNIFLAGGAGVAAGIAFWALFERAFMTRTLKKPLVDFLRPRIERLCEHVGLPHHVELMYSRRTIAVNTASGTNEVEGLPIVGLASLDAPSNGPRDALPEDTATEAN